MNTSRSAERLMLSLALSAAFACGRAEPRSSAGALREPNLHSTTLSPANSGRMLPGGAYRASITLEGEAPADQVRGGGSGEYLVRVANLGDTPFPAFPDPQGRGAVNLTCRIYTASPAPAVAGGCNRFTMPADLQPGQSIVLKVVVPYPAAAGAYDVHIELVHEMLAWFVDQGSPPLVIRVKVA